MKNKIILFREMFFLEMQFSIRQLIAKNLKNPAFYSATGFFKIESISVGGPFIINPRTFIEEG
ncbi:TPA: hypothetical protein ONB80_004419 [Enterobacter kobei]|nr:hypothetical protein [Enterobacter kobei]